MRKVRMKRGFIAFAVAITMGSERQSGYAGECRNWEQDR